tara:strand:- start:3659 stop:4318 length:660 start_codon:yes stop_codon:yes gene_type:complete
MSNKSKIDENNLKLINAIKEKDITSVNEALKGKNGAQLNYKYNTDDIYDDPEYTPIFLAVINGERDIVKTLLKNYPNKNDPDDPDNPINHRDMEENTPIFLAIDNEDYKMVNLLIEEGANLKIKNNLGDTPLDHTYKNVVNNKINQKQKEIITLLINKLINNELDKFKSKLNDDTIGNIKDFIIENNNTRKKKYKKNKNNKTKTKQNKTKTKTKTKTND